MELKYIVKKYNDEDSEIDCKIYKKDETIIVKVVSWYFDLEYEVTIDDYEEIYNNLKADFLYHTMEIFMIKIIDNDKSEEYLTTLELLANEVSDLVDKMYEL